ncbi:MAG: nitroreductase family protein [Armatimonadota bacterium]
MVETIETIRQRRSIRAYKSDPVSESDLREIVAAGFCAPAAQGKRAVHIIVVRDSDKRWQLAQINQWSRYLVQAPAIIAVCVDKDAAGDFWVDDGSAFMENLMLAARSKGLGTCWIGIHDAIYDGTDSEHTVRDILNVPANMRILALTPVGYPAEEKPAKDLEFPEKNVHWDTFDNQ